MRKNHNQSRDYGQPGVMVEVTEADVQKHLRNRKFGTWLLDKVAGIAMPGFARFRAENDAMVANDKAARAQRGEPMDQHTASASESQVQDWFKVPELAYPSGVIGGRRSPAEPEPQPAMASRPLGNEVGWTGPASELLPPVASAVEAGQGFGIHPAAKQTQHFDFDPNDPALTAHQGTELAGSHR